MRYRLPAPASQSRALILSDRAYRLLLAAYPGEFRQRYGPEMAQVFRTCCRLTYRASGAGGVARLWLPTLWDWAWSALRERFSSLFRRPKMYNVHIGRARSQLVPIFLFLNACLICMFINPCCWLFGDYIFAEFCSVEVNNQSGKTLRVTPIDADNPYSAVRLYRENIPSFLTYQQRNISVESGENVTLSYNCDQARVSKIYACDLDGECYVHQHPQSIAYKGWEGHEFIFKSLENLSRPDAALEAAVQSFPEHNYRGGIFVLLCIIQVISLIGGVYWLVRTRTFEIPKHDI